jgi:hypothetical protein
MPKIIQYSLQQIRFAVGETLWDFNYFSLTICVYSAIIQVVSDS